MTRTHRRFDNPCFDYFALAPDEALHALPVTFGTKPTDFAEVRTADGLAACRSLECLGSAITAGALDALRGARPALRVTRDGVAL